MSHATAPVIKASGGVVCRIVGGVPYFAVVHKRKYSTWGLPKGKLSQDEGWVEAALREVTEETGATGRVLGPRVTSSYFVEGVPKVVVWHLMLETHPGRFEASEEIDAVDWIDERDALARLTHPAERRVFQELVSHLTPDPDTGL